MNRSEKILLFLSRTSKRCGEEKGCFITNIIILLILASNLYSYPLGWSDDILINQDTTGNQRRPDISADSQNNVWISWDNATLASGEIYYSKRDSLGNVIIPETTVSNNATKSWMARIAVDNSDKVQFVWRDASPLGDGVWHAKLANDGTVIVPSHLAVSGGGGIGISTEIALDKYQNINIVWEEQPTTYSQMSYTQLDSFGNPIIDKIRITPESLRAYWVGIGVDSFANSHLACRTDTTGIQDRLTYSKLDKDGNILISNKILGFGSLATIVADQSQNIHMIYCNPVGPGIRVEYLKLDQSGNILIGPDTISPPTILYNTYSHMAIDSEQHLHVVWQSDESSVCQIMYCKLDTLGNYVITPMKIVHQPHTSGAGEPRIAVDHSDRLHVTWIDARLGSVDIFYKRGENEPYVEESTSLKKRNLPKITVLPNPFFYETKIRFSSLQKTDNITINIFDIIGRKVKEFILDKSEATIIWCGDDDEGTKLSTGVYFVQVRTKNVNTIKKIIKLQ